MDNDWISFKEVDFTDENILQYHIDTRDFCCFANTEKPNEPVDISKLKKYPERFFYSSEEVVALLNRYYEESGGEKDWRFFALEGMSNWELKYIRIYRTEFGLIICTQSKYALKKEITDLKVENDY